MGKKNKPVLGRSIIKNRFGRNNDKRIKEGFLRHLDDIDDGYDWARLNLRSVTDQTNLDEFLATAELAGTEFTAEKLNVTFVNSNVTEGLLSAEEKVQVDLAQKQNKRLLSIPRRPRWDTNMKTDELNQLEREGFLEWRKQLAELQEIEGILLTPYEKNLEFWKQLWRVVERSDIIVQIVDARNPLLFRCEDLEKYVLEVSADKMNMILVNKADFLTERQRAIWAAYFESIALPVVFFCAVQQCAVIGEDEEEATGSSGSEEEEEETEEADDKVVQESRTSEMSTEDLFAKGKLCSRMELIEVFKRAHTRAKVHDSVTTVGLVGYPNVGKSSTINAILTEKKVSVSETPGKTKHFQTIYVDHDLILCDCPGLVMPTFISTKAEMVVSGILPIDQMKDHVGPVNLIPRHILELMYSIILPPPMEGEDPNRPPTSEELLNSYGYMRGFMTQRGMPDNPRTARYVLKDYVCGKLLFCNAPPGVSQDEYHQYPSVSRRNNPTQTPLQRKIMKASKMSIQNVDDFFEKPTAGVHIRKPSCVYGLASAGYKQRGPLADGQKPWKKHHNRNKREKLRRVYSHLDE